MANMSALYFILAVNCLLSISSYATSVTPNQEYKTTWCVAQDNAPNDKLQAFIDYTCSQVGVSCGPIQPGGTCFEPNTLKGHGSYALASIYSKDGNCGEIGTVIEKDPSYGACFYPSHLVGKH